MANLLTAVILLLVMLSPIRAAEHSPLMPQPQEVRYGSGRTPVRGLVIQIPADPTPEDSFAANTLSVCLAERTSIRVPIGRLGAGSRTIALKRTGSPAALPLPAEQPGPESREAYRLTVRPEGIELRAVSTAGLFYGAQTLCQLAEGQADEAVIPQVEIDDWPSFVGGGPQSQDHFSSAIS